MLILPLRQVSQRESTDGGLCSTFLSSSALIQIVQMARGETHCLLPLRNEHFLLRVGSSPKALQRVLLSYQLPMQNIYIDSGWPYM